MLDRPGRYTELSQRGIEENSLRGVTLNGEKSGDKTLEPKQFFLTVAKNLQDLRTATDTHSKTRNREEENLDMVVMWNVLCLLIGRCAVFFMFYKLDLKLLNL